MLSVKKSTFPQLLKKATNKKTVSQICLYVIFAVLILLPVIRMLFFMTPEKISAVTADAQFSKAVLNSVWTTLVSTIFSVALAYLLAWSMTRTNIKFKGVFSIIIVLPMLIPSISHGMGLIHLFGNNGFITNLFGSTKSIYGHLGIIVGSVLYSFPVAYLMIADILKYEDSSSYEAADILGISKFRQFKKITFPYLRKPMISVIFATFTLIITDYGVPISVGGNVKTLPVLLFDYAANQLDYASGSFISLLLLIPAVISFLFDLFNKDKGKSSFVTRAFEPRKSKIKTAVGYISCILVSLFTCLVIFSFCVQAFAKSYPIDKSFTFKHFTKVFNQSGGKYLINSLGIALCTSLIGVCLSFVTAYFTARVKNGSSKALHLLSITTLAVPGLVLGLSYVILFNSTFLYGTIILLILVNVMHFFASPYLMMYNALNKTNENLESTGSVLGISRFKIIKDVILPQSKETIVEMFSYFFVNSMMTISAVSILAGTGNKPLSLMINQFQDLGYMECAAVIAIIILAVNVLMKLIVRLIKKLGERNNANKKAV